MDSKIAKFMNQGEQVVWQSKPEQISLFDMPHAITIIIRWIIAAVCVVASIKYYTFSLANAVPMSRALVIMAFLIAIAIIIAIAPFKTKKRMETYYNYIVTNERFMAYSTDKSTYVYYPYRNLEDIKEITVKYMPNGNATVFVGKTNSTSSLIERSYLPVVPSTDEDRPLIFYNIKNLADLTPLFPKNAKVKYIGAPNRSAQSQASAI